jgi:hypothetical protein
MDKAREMVLLPSSAVDRLRQHGGGNDESKKLVDKISRLLKILLKLARVDGYDISGRIKRQDGSIVENSDITVLLNYANTPGRVLIGEKEFIELLYKAHVEPELVINDNLRAKLTKVYENVEEPVNEQPIIENEQFMNQPHDFSDVPQPRVALGPFRPNIPTTQTIPVLDEEKVAKRIQKYKNNKRNDAEEKRKKISQQVKINRNLTRLKTFETNRNRPAQRNLNWDYPSEDIPDLENDENDWDL